MLEFAKDKEKALTRWVDGLVRRSQANGPGPKPLVWKPPTRSVGQLDRPCTHGPRQGVVAPLQPVK